MADQNKVIAIPKNESEFKKVFNSILDSEKEITHLSVVWLDGEGNVHDYWIAESSSFMTLGMVDWAKTRIKNHLKEDQY